MSTLKIPSLLAVAFETHATMTPPNPPPPPAERLAPRGMERVAPMWVPLLVKVGRRVHLLVHALFLSCTLAESLVILVRHVPTLPFAHKFLKTLDPANAASRLTFTRTFLLGAALSFTGTAIRIHCYRVLRNFFTFELGIRVDHHLITTGPYAIVRHPSYSGVLLAGTSAVVCTLVPGAWAVECAGVLGPRGLAALWVVGFSLAGIGLWTRMRKEDEMLKGRFGKE
ncbi:Protein-S-isoprenylcysteine O-methyltransferase [Mycena sanguinolenta]|uniref:Protein-S-isoprenylcysteine O-methyltransferase n=1 Tax=Mycena sanguinolenta TaxID=230812 RepID=A0A8H6ZFZ3_9AGAR|nr:Protein-S-isoprenylcysteine O-methyltransferase [Mycena sanguinolenta]